MTPKRLEELKRKVDEHFKNISPEELSENVKKSIEAYDMFVAEFGKYETDKSKYDEIKLEESQ